MAILADLTPALRANHNALRDTKTGSIRPGDLISIYVAPIVFGAAGGYFTLFPKDANPLLTIVSILAGLSFALSVFVFELRMTASAKYDKGSPVLGLIDRFFSSVLYSVVVGIASALLCFGASIPEYGGLVYRLVSGVAIAMTLHYIVGLFVSLNRLRKAYNTMIR